MNNPYYIIIVCSVFIISYQKIILIKITITLAMSDTSIPQKIKKPSPQIAPYFLPIPEIQVEV